MNGGLGVKVPVHDAAGQTTAFFVRYQDRVHGYLNRCAHVGVELDWEGSFFTRAGDLIMCARHGATYQPDTGLRGRPLQNGRLTALDVQERDGAVYWRPPARSARWTPPERGPSLAAGRLVCCPWLGAIRRGRLQARAASDPGRRASPAAGASRSA